MHPSPLHYFPVTPLFMLLLGLVLVLVIALIEVHVITYAYEKMGIQRRYVFGILLLSLLGSGVNIPIAELPAKDVPVEQVVNFFGVEYVVPAVEHQGNTILAINLGGALIPLALSIYLLLKHNLYIKGALAIAVVAAVTHFMAQPVRGVGIALSPLVAPVVAALAAMIISREREPHWRISPAAWARSSAPISSICTEFRNSPRQSLLLAGQGWATASSWPASWPSCWRDATMNRNSRCRRPIPSAGRTIRRIPAPVGRTRWR